jgi:hypothetical protein
MSCPAFVTGPVVLVRPTTSLTASTFTPTCTRPQVAVAKLAAVRMALPPSEDGKHKVPEGFTMFSEQLNGRFAMIGFVALLGAEILSPAHPNLIQQIGSIFPSIM